MTDFRQQHPDGIVLALDQMSAYLQATLTRVWYPRGQTPCVWVTPRRDHIHFYGALNVISGQDVVLPMAELTAENTRHFLKHVLTCFPGRAILLLWDRAPWHKGVARQFVDSHPLLDAIAFPVGCPDINPQEHVWKQARDNVGHLHIYSHLGHLREAFQTFLETALFQFDWIEKYLPTILYEFDFI